MHVVIVTHVIKREDGQGRVNFELAQDLLRSGHRLTLITTELDPGLQADEAVLWVRVTPSKLPTFLLRHLAFAVRTTFALRPLRGAVDVVIVNGFVTWCRSQINLVHFVHSAWLKSALHPARSGFGLEQAYRWFYSALNTLLERDGFRRCEVLVAVSQLVRQQLIEAGVPPAKIEVVANGVDLAVFKPGERDRAGFGLPDAAFTVMFAGDIRSSRKNLETVLRAMVDLPDAVLVVAGDTRSSPYPAMADVLGIADRVHFLGLISDISRLMRCADAFVFPSRFEPFGLVVLEASACGLPVITSQAVGACDVLAPEGMMLIDSPEDVAGIVRALRSLADDTALRVRMGQAAHRAAQQLSWDNVMKSYRRIIADLPLRQQAAS